MSAENAHYLHIPQAVLTPGICTGVAVKHLVDKEMNPGAIAEAENATAELRAPSEDEIDEGSVYLDGKYAGASTFVPRRIGCVTCGNEVSLSAEGGVTYGTTCATTDTCQVTLVKTRPELFPEDSTVDCYGCVARVRVQLDEEKPTAIVESGGCTVESRTGTWHKTLEDQSKPLDSEENAQGMGEEMQEFDGEKLSNPDSSPSLF